MLYFKTVSFAQVNLYSFFYLLCRTRLTSLSHNSLSLSLVLSLFLSSFTLSLIPPTLSLSLFLSSSLILIEIKLDFD